MVFPFTGTVDIGHRDRFREGRSPFDPDLHSGISRVLEYIETVPVLQGGKAVAQIFSQHSQRG